MYFSARDGTVYAHDAEGKEKWSHHLRMSEAELKHFNTPFHRKEPLPIILIEDSERVYASSLNHIAALEKSSGKVVWSLDRNRATPERAQGSPHGALSGFYYPLLLHDGVLFTLVNEHLGDAHRAHMTQPYKINIFEGPYSLVGMDPATGRDVGRVKVSLAFEDFVFGACLVARGTTLLIATTPLRGRELSKVTSSLKPAEGFHATVLAIDWNAKKEMWRTPLPSLYPSHITVSTTHVAVATGLDVLLLDPFNGHIVCKTAVPEVEAHGNDKSYNFWQRLHSLVHDPATNALYVAHAGAVFALDGTTLQQRWSAHVDNSESKTATVLALFPAIPGAVLATSSVGGGVTLFAHDGTVRWQCAGLPSHAKGAKFHPLHHNDAVIVEEGFVIVSADGCIRVLDAQTGNELEGLRVKGRNEFNELPAPEASALPLTEQVLSEEHDREAKGASEDLTKMLVGWLWPPIGLVFLCGWASGRGKKMAADKTWNAPH